MNLFSSGVRHSGDLIPIGFLIILFGFDRDRLRGKGKLDRTTLNIMRLITTMKTSIWKILVCDFLLEHLTIISINVDPCRYVNKDVHFYED